MLCGEKTKFLLGQGSIEDVNTGTNLVNHLNARLILSMWVTPLRLAGFKLSTFYNPAALEAPLQSVFWNQLREMHSFYHKKISETKKKKLTRFRVEERNAVRAESIICFHCYISFEIQLSAKYFYILQALFMLLFYSFFFFFLNNHIPLLLICAPFYIPSHTLCLLFHPALPENQMRKRQCKICTAPGLQLLSYVI